MLTSGSQLEARRLGASFVSANIASILQQDIVKDAKAESTFLGIHIPSGHVEAL